MHLIHMHSHSYPLFCEIFNQWQLKNYKIIKYEAIEKKLTRFGLPPGNKNGPIISNPQNKTANHTSTRKCKQKNEVKNCCENVFSV